MKFRQSVGISGREDTIASFDRDLLHMVRGWVKVDGASAFPNFDSNDPLDYERWCADILRRHGWEASTTKASGDQGVDIIATKNARKAAFQCKLYSGTVGNKAVQEIHAAAAYVEATYAAVVSNADYTPAARRLAAKLGVLLLHHSQLSKLEGMLPKPVASSNILMPSGSVHFIIPPDSNLKS